MPELEGAPLTDDTMSIMLSESVRQRDVPLAQRIERLARKSDSPMTDVVYTLLVKAFAADADKVHSLVDEFAARSSISTDLALAVLCHCSQTKDLSLADRLYAQASFAKQPQVLSAFIKLYADNDSCEKACDVYEKEEKNRMSSDSSQKALLLDTHVERSLMNAALRCGRTALAKKLLDSPSGHVAKHITMIRNCACENNLQGAMRVFESLQQGGAEMNTVIYNTVLDACVECHDLKAAEAWMAQMKEAGMIDVVSFNTLIKAHLMQHNFGKLVRQSNK
jgi:pentatricopeptide repeat protein